MVAAKLDLKIEQGVPYSFKWIRTLNGFPISMSSWTGQLIIKDLNGTVINVNPVITIGASDGSVKIDLDKIETAKCNVEELEYQLYLKNPLDVPKRFYEGSITVDLDLRP